MLTVQQAVDYWKGLLGDTYPHIAGSFGNNHCSGDKLKIVVDAENNRTLITDEGVCWYNEAIYRKEQRVADVFFLERLSGLIIFNLTKKYPGYQYDPLIDLSIMSSIRRDEFLKTLPHWSDVSGFSSSTDNCIVHIYGASLKLQHGHMFIMSESGETCHVG